MNKIIFIITILNLLLNTSCFSSRATHDVYLDEPDWFAHPKIKSGFIQGKGWSTKVGTDEGKCIAITQALFDIILKMRHTVQKKDSIVIDNNDNMFWDERYTVVNSTAFGNIKLDGQYEEYIEDEVHSFKEIFKLSYIKEGKSLIFVNHFEEIGEGLDAEIIHKFHFIKQDFSIDELLKELKDYGFSYKFDVRKEAIYFVLEIDRELLIKKQNIDPIINDNKMLDQTNRGKQSDIKLEASKAQKKLQEDLGKYNLKQSNN